MSFNQHVSEFVGAIRHEVDLRDEIQNNGASNNGNNDRKNAVIYSMQEARTHADKAIVQAERHTVAVETPPGEFARQHHVSSNTHREGVLECEIPNQAGFKVMGQINPQIQVLQDGQANVKPTIPNG